MKASILEDTKKIKIVDMEIPELSNKDVLVKVFCVGICGTDVSVYRGIYPAKKNIILGHEFCGEVVKVGQDVEKVAPKDYVVSEASWGCNSCYWCEKNYYNYCESPHRLGRTINGSLAEFIILPENVLHKIDNSVSYIDAQSVVAVSTALRALKRGDVKLGDKVVIIGPGYSGLIMLQLCKLIGAGVVGMIGTRDNRLKIAEDLGADFIVNIRTDKEWLNKLLNIYKYGFDICIEASGTISGFQSAMNLIKKGGTIIQFGASFDKINDLPLKDFYNKEISIIGSRGGFGFYKKAIELLEMKKLKIEPLITHRFKLDEVPKAFNIMDKRLENVLRCVVFCNE